ncbi:MAG: hypothetical protein AB7O38_23385 [Pirellulaceae bacterium]
MSVLHVSCGFLVAFLSAFGPAGGPVARRGAAPVVEAAHIDSDPMGAIRGVLRPPEPRVDAWRRTVHGWEQRDERAWLEPALTSLPPAAAIHPLVVASLFVLVSVGSLLSLSPSAPCRRPR